MITYVEIRVVFQSNPLYLFVFTPLTAVIRVLEFDSNIVPRSWWLAIDKL